MSNGEESASFDAPSHSYTLQSKQATPVRYHQGPHRDSFSLNDLIGAFLHAQSIKNYEYPACNLHQDMRLKPLPLLVHLQLPFML